MEELCRVDAVVPDPPHNKMASDFEFVVKSLFWAVSREVDANFPKVNVPLTCRPLKQQDQQFQPSTNPRPK